ncbi:MAG: choice-of-anchor L domain-containing protein [Bacteroidia bacterium]|nr:choice-of-anchor L domain-containing protein [Bacteroidia bacterium]
MKKIIAFLSFLLVAISSTFAQLVITSGGGAAAVTSAVAGPGLTVSNVTVNCAAVSYGSFSGGAASGMGINNGLVLTTGTASQIVGANTNNDFTGACVGNSGSDPQLIALSNQATNDVCIIEFDVIPQCNNLSISFVFGSDEYTDYVNASFNDAFGFFVSGPNPGGGNYTNFNLATIPGGTAVSIDNVSHLTNTAYFVNNNGATFNNSFDGFTTVLTPSMNVTPCATYHFKLAIADASDCLMDSGVMIDIIQCTAPWTVTTSSTAAGCGVNNGTATATVAGGIGPFSYSWAPSGGTGATASGLAAGSYTVTVNDGLTCTPAQTYTVTVAGSGGSPVTANSQTICAGASTTLTATPTTTGGTYSWAPGGQTTQSITVSPASTTTYTVTYNFGGCNSTSTGTVTVNPLPTVTVNSQTICAGASATLTATPSAGGGTYSWAPGGQTTQSITVTPGSTTTYTVTYTLAGCTGTGTGTVTVNPLPTIAVNSPTICPGQNATLTATGGTTYAWSTGATTNPITVSPASTTSYTVTGTTSGCSNTAVATVTIGASMTITVNSPTICNGQSATLTATGGTTYSWNTGATTNPITVSPTTTTTYTVTGTTGGCSGTAVATVTVNAIPTVTSTSSTICNGQTTSLTAGGATTYNWNTGATTSTLSVTPSTTTTYTVTGTTSGCSNTATGTVTVNNAPTVTVNSPSVCPGSNATLTANGATTYTWSTGATTNPITVAPLSTTSYTVTGTTLGCTATAVATVTMNTSLTVDAGLNDTICFGSNTTLNVTPANAGSTFTWSPATGLSSTAIANPIANPTATTIYSVTVTDINGCSGTDNVTVFVDPQLTLAISGIDLTCNGAGNGQTIVIPNGGTIPYSYNWTGGCSSASCSGLSAGSYTVTVTDAFGCTSTADTTIIEPPLLVASINGSTQVTCNGACNGTATAMAIGGTTNYSYSWNTSPVQTTATATGLCAGSYTCTITDANGCTATTTVTITQPSLVELAPITNITICNGGNASVTASAIGGNGPYTYSWSPATGLSSTTGSTVTANPTTTTTYTVNASDANGCSALPVTVTITVNPLLSVTASGTASICPGAATPITATAANGNGGPYTYSWSPATGLSNANAANPTASPTVTTTYTVTANDGCSPAATSTVTITVTPVPTVDFTSNLTSGCAPLCVNFTDASSATGGTINSWSWNFGPNEGGSSLQNPTHCFVNAGIYSISLTVSSNNGCSNDTTITNMITVFANPVAGFSAPLSTSILAPIVQFTNTSTDATIFNWNFGDPTNTSSPNTSTQANPSHTYGDIGTYCVTLIASNTAGCTDTTEMCVVIDPEFTFFIPNAFSPNGDGINDEFYGKGEYIKEFEMFIYDRWGNMIFFTDDINKHWDGKANNGAEVAQQDVYVYVVNLKDNKSQKHKYIGTVTIVK